MAEAMVSSFEKTRIVLEAGAARLLDIPDAQRDSVPVG